VALHVCGDLLDRGVCAVRSVDWESLRLPAADLHRDYAGSVRLLCADGAEAGLSEKRSRCARCPCLKIETWGTRILSGREKAVSLPLEAHLRRSVTPASKLAGDPDAAPKMGHPVWLVPGESGTGGRYGCLRKTVSLRLMRTHVRGAAQEWVAGNGTRWRRRGEMCSTWYTLAGLREGPLFFVD
jgi:hypothetical protein